VEHPGMARWQWQSLKKLEAKLKFNFLHIFLYFGALANVGL